MLQLQIPVNLSLYSSVTCCFFRSTYTLKKKLNATFVFLKNSIVNNNAKNESWKSNSRKCIIQWLKVVIYVQSHYSFKTHTHTEKQTIRSQNHNRFLRSCHYHFLLLLFLPLWFRQWSLHSQILVFFAVYINLKKKQLNITFVFLKNSIVNNNAKNESWKSNSRRGIIQNKECKGLVFSHFRLFLLSPFHDFPPFIGQRPFRRTCGWFFFCRLPFTSLCSFPPFVRYVFCLFAALVKPKTITVL